jgi:bla regulator protein blaR1
MSCLPFREDHEKPKCGCELIPAVSASLIVVVALAILNARALAAQDAGEWQAQAGGQRKFDVASVKPSTGAVGPPSFPLNAGEAYNRTGGYFRADFPLLLYIEFAYKILPVAVEEREMLAHAPQWFRTNSYRIEARAEGNPSKDQMRLMMQSLLAERFQFRAHFESKEMPVLALTLVKAGKVGPKLLSHRDGPPCGDFEQSGGNAWQTSPIRGSEAGGFPPFCDSVALIRRPGGMLMLGYRNATMDLLAGSLSGAVGQGRRVINKTGLSGRYDFTLEWMPTPSSPPEGESATGPADLAGPTSLEALRDQLGLKVEAMKGSIQMLVIDKVERPSQN